MFGDGLSLQQVGSPAAKALESRYRIVPISVAGPADLAEGRFLLMAHPPAQPAFEAQSQKVMCRTRLAELRSGLELEVKFDPKDPQTVEVLPFDGWLLPPTGAAARLLQLNALRQKGLLSDEEYRRQRAEIIKAI
jgi:hypothetical protein